MAHICNLGAAAGRQRQAGPGPHWPASLTKSANSLELQWEVWLQNISWREVGDGQC